MSTNYPLYFDEIALDNNGNPLTGGFLNAKYAGTANPAPTYNDAGVLNPVNIPISIYGTYQMHLDDSIVYDIYIFSPTDSITPLRTRPNVRTGGTGGGGGIVTLPAHTAYANNYGYDAAAHAVEIEATIVGKDDTHIASVEAVRNVDTAKLNNSGNDTFDGNLTVTGAVDALSVETDTLTIGGTNITDMFPHGTGVADRVARWNSANEIDYKALSLDSNNNLSMRGNAVIGVGSVDNTITGSSTNTVGANSSSNLLAGSNNIIDANVNNAAIVGDNNRIHTTASQTQIIGHNNDVTGPDNIVIGDRNTQISGAGELVIIGNDNGADDAESMIFGTDNTSTGGSSDSKLVGHGNSISNAANSNVFGSHNIVNNVQNVVVAGKDITISGTDFDPYGVHLGNGSHNNLHMHGRLVGANNVYASEGKTVGFDANGEMIVANQSSVSAGVASYPGPEWTPAGVGMITMPSCEAYLYDNANFTGEVNKYTIASDTFTLTDGADQLVVVDYNAGSPIYRLVTTTHANYNGSSIVVAYRFWRVDTNIHSASIDSLGIGLSNKIATRIGATEYYARTNNTGLDLSEDGSLHVGISAAGVYGGAVYYDIATFNSATNNMGLAVKTGSTWTITNGYTQYPNTVFNPSTGLSTLSNNKYTCVYFYRTIGDVNEGFMVLSQSEYNSVELASADAPRTDIPLMLSGHCILVGRIIIQKSASSGVIESAFNVFGFVTTGNALTVVTHDTTLTGDGTVTTPLGLSGIVVTDMSLTKTTSPTITVGKVDSTQATVTIQGATGSEKRLLLGTGTTARWGFISNNTAESTGDIGSNFALRSYNDAGQLIDTPIAIVRASGGNISMARSIVTTNPIYFNTSTGFIGAFTSNDNDTATVTLAGGGATSNSRGGYITVKGNEVATNGGDVVIEAGNGIKGEILCYTSGAERIKIGKLLADGVRFSTDITMNGDYNVRASTSDGSDQSAIALCGGGAATSNRGGYIYVRGNDRASTGGTVSIVAGDATSVQGDIYFTTNDTERIRITKAGTISIGVSTASSGTVNDLMLTTADGSDNQLLRIRGSGTGGATSDLRAAMVALHGNEYPTNGGTLTLMAGNGIEGDVIFYTGASTERLRITKAGLISLYGNPTISSTGSVFNITNASGGTVDIKGKLVVGDSIITCNIPIVSASGAALNIGSNGTSQLTFNTAGTGIASSVVFTGRQLITTLQSSSTTTGAIAWDANSGGKFKLTYNPTGNVTITVSNIYAGETGKLFYIMGATSYTMTLAKTGTTFFVSNTTTSSTDTITLNSVINTNYAITLEWISANVCYISY